MVEGAKGPEADPIELIAIRIWNALGGEVRIGEAALWAQLYGVDDFDTLAELLLTIRDVKREAE